MDISDVISQQLRDIKMRQAELARRLGVGRSTVHFWCNGVNRPRMDKLPKIASVLGLKSVRDFF